MAYDCITSSEAKILCIDDDEPTLEAYRQYFQSTPHSVGYAQEAEEGIHLIKNEIPDVIFCDVKLPGKNDGYLYEEIGNDSRLQKSVIVLVAAKKGGQDWLQRVRLTGAYDYLIKPIEKHELSVKVDLALRTKRLEENLLKSKQKLNKTLGYIKRLKFELEKKKSALLSEKVMLQNSLKQISLMVEDRERVNQDLEKLSRIHAQNFNSLVEILSSTIEAKCQYHRGHSKKVAEISCFIAREFKLSDKMIRDIEVAAHLHELGRLSLPDTLAKKTPDQYTRAEKVFLRSHPVEAADLLDKFSGFQAIARIVKHFHENYDGSGTPDGLRHDEIPIGSRILAGADLFDDLVYQRKGSSLHDSFQRIEKKVGVRLDAKVVHYLHKYSNLYPVNDLEKARQIKLVELESGMELAAGIYTQRGAKLLPINTILKKDSIMQLAQYARREALEENVFIK